VRALALIVAAALSCGPALAGDSAAARAGKGYLQSADDERLLYVLFFVQGLMWGSPAGSCGEQQATVIAGSVVELRVIAARVDKRLLDALVRDEPISPGLAIAEAVAALCADVPGQPKPKRGTL
jgi:hypothetical protein